MVKDHIEDSILKHKPKVLLYESLLIKASALVTEILLPYLLALAQELLSKGIPHILHKMSEYSLQAQAMKVVTNRLEKSTSPMPHCPEIIHCVLATIDLKPEGFTLYSTLASLEVLIQNSQNLELLMRRHLVQRLLVAIKENYPIRGSALVQKNLPAMGVALRTLITLSTGQYMKDATRVIAERADILLPLLQPQILKAATIMGQEVHDRRLKMLTNFLIRIVRRTIELFHLLLVRRPRTTSVSPLQAAIGVIDSHRELTLAGYETSDISNVMVSALELLLSSQKNPTILAELKTTPNIINKLFWIISTRQLLSPLWLPCQKLFDLLKDVTTIADQDMVQWMFQQRNETLSGLGFSEFCLT